MKNREPNYRGLYVIGISFIAIGTSLISTQPKSAGTAFIALGGVFLIVALKNKEKWTK